MIFVAAHNSSSRAKANADFLCDGVDDQVEWNQAIAALCGAPGTVLGYEGDYNFNRETSFGTVTPTAVALPHSGITLRGEGWATRWRLEDGQDCNLIRSIGDGLNHLFVEDLYLDGNKANQTTATTFEVCCIHIKTTGVTKYEHVWVRRVFAENAHSLCVAVGGNHVHVRDSEFGNADFDIVEILLGQAGDIMGCTARVSGVCGYVFGTDALSGATISDNTTYITASGEVSQSVHRLWPGQCNNVLADNKIILEDGAKINNAIECGGYFNQITGNFVGGRYNAKPNVVLSGGSNLVGNTLNYVKIVDTGLPAGWPILIADNIGYAVTLPTPRPHLTIGTNTFF